MRHTCLSVGQIITVRQEVRDRVKKFERSITKMMGFGVQFEHDFLLREGGYAVVTFKDHEPIDRMLGTDWQDDKLSTYFNFKTKSMGTSLSCSHTIGSTELPTWRDSTTDVTIHSFAQVTPADFWSARYLGTYSFKKLDLENRIKEKDDGSAYFFRD